MCKLANQESKQQIANQGLIAKLTEGLLSCCPAFIAVGEKDDPKVTK